MWCGKSENLKRGSKLLVLFQVKKCRLDPCWVISEENLVGPGRIGQCEQKIVAFLTTGII